MSSPEQNIFLKLENVQRTGSFKVRGAFNKIASLTPEARKHGIICSSAGNHAQGVALGGQVFGVPTYICMPTTTPQAKIENTASYGANIILHGDVYDDAAAKARELQAEKGYTYVHPFDDDVVIAGQGTIGCEILEQLEQCDSIVVPIGGGGLISGIAVAVKSLRPEVKVIGVQAAGAPAMVQSVEKGERVILPSAHTIADGIQVREPGKRTFELVKKYVDEVVTVEEKDIHAAILYLIEKHHIVSEGAGAVPTAAVLAGKISKEHKNVCLLVSGGNIDVNIVSRLIDRGLILQDRRFRFETEVPDRPGGLAALMGVLAEQRANIYHVEQSRQKLLSKFMVQIVEVTVELHGKEHKERLLKALQDNGYPVKSM